MSVRERCIEAGPPAVMADRGLGDEQNLPLLIGQPSPHVFVHGSDGLTHRLSLSLLILGLDAMGWACSSVCQAALP